MVPRTITNPAPQTAAARAALQSFFCDLCGKGYARQNEFAAHEASYEHNHNQRRADLRRMNTQMSSAAASGGGGGGGGGGAGGARRGSAGEGGMIKIQLGSSGQGSSNSSKKKKGGFKSAFAPVGPAKTGDQGFEMYDVAGDEAVTARPRGNGESGGNDDADADDDDTDDDYELYNPRCPTGCGPLCAGRA